MVCLAEVAGSELLPLAAEKLSPVLGAMKLAGYRSADSYLHEVRLRHTQRGHPVSGELSGVLQGRGPGGGARPRAAEEGAIRPVGDPA